MLKLRSLTPLFLGGLFAIQFVRFSLRQHIYLFLSFNEKHRKFIIHVIHAFWGDGRSRLWEVFGKSVSPFPPVVPMFLSLSPLRMPEWRHASASACCCDVGGTYRMLQLILKNHSSYSLHMCWLKTEKCTEYCDTDTHLDLIALANTRPRPKFHSCTRGYPYVPSYRNYCNYRNDVVASHCGAVFCLMKGPSGAW